MTFPSLCLTGSAVGSAHIRSSLDCIPYAVHSSLLCSSRHTLSDAGHLGLGHQTVCKKAITVPTGQRLHNVRMGYTDKFSASVSICVKRRRALSLGTSTRATVDQIMENGIRYIHAYIVYEAHRSRRPMSAFLWLFCLISTEVGSRAVSQPGPCISRVVRLRLRSIP